MGGKAFKKERKGRNFGNPKKYVISAERSPPDMHVMCNNSVTHKRYTKQNFILQYMKIFIKTVDTLRRSQCKRTKCFFSEHNGHKQWLRDRKHRSGVAL